MPPPASLDRRITPLRDDLAAAHLRGVVEGRAFVEPRRHQIRVASVPVRREPDVSLPYDTEWLFGEAIDIYDVRGGWAWGQSVLDDYVGYVPVESFGPPTAPATHRVSALRTFVYPVPSIKSTPVAALTLGTNLAVKATEERFALTSLGYVFAAHLAPIGVLAVDPVAEAERFIGVPYLWGGRTSLGIDCSGLIQTACLAAGISAPRDSDLQEAMLGEALDIPGDPDEFQRGDLLFWRGHVAFCQGGGMMIHATAYTMSVISEPIAPALARIAAAGEPLRSARRLG